MEYHDVIDDEHRVVGTASEKEIYEQKRPHRIVHTLLFLFEQQLVQKAFKQHGG